MGVRDIFRRPSPDVLQGKERTLANVRAAHARAEKLARLARLDEWAEYVDVLTENIRSIESTLKIANAKKFLTEEEQRQRALLMERKETYERCRTIAQNASDSVRTLEDQLIELQQAVNDYRERLGAGV